MLGIVIIDENEEKARRLAEDLLPRLAYKGDKVDVVVTNDCGEARKLPGHGKKNRVFIIGSVGDIPELGNVSPLAHIILWSSADGGVIRRANVSWVSRGKDTNVGSFVNLISSQQAQ